MALVPDVQLRIAGDGLERAALERLVKDLGTGNVTFEGHKTHDELLRLMAGSRAVVVPSECHEVCSNTVLEAQSVGRAVIGTRMGGTPEIMVDGETGILVRPADIDDLVAAIRVLAQDVDLAAKMGRDGRRSVAGRHSPEGYYAALIELYRETLEIHAAKEPWVWRRAGHASR